jgi:hypothetical protein
VGDTLRDFQNGRRLSRMTRWQKRFLVALGFGVVLALQPYVHLKPFSKPPQRLTIEQMNERIANPPKRMTIEEVEALLEKSGG